jgi:hypothetical protein
VHVSRYQKRRWFAREDASVARNCRAAALLAAKSLKSQDKKIFQFFFKKTLKFPKSLPLIIPDGRESVIGPGAWGGKKVVMRPKVPDLDAVTFGECCFAASKKFSREP